MPAPGPSLRVFVSYAHEDRHWCDKLVRHLGALRGSGRIRLFDDSQIEPGEWEAQLRSELDEADVIVLIVTASFGDSRFCTGVELTRAIDRASARVIPILAEHCDWGALPIGRFQVLPQDQNRNLKPLSEWTDVNEPLAQIAQTIRRLVDEIGDDADTDVRVPDVRGIARGGWIRPEAPDRIYGRESDLRPIVQTLTADPPGDVVVFGTAGIGKTMLTLQAACAPLVIAFFGDRRCLVKLDAADSPEALVVAICGALDLPPSTDPWVAIKATLGASDLATLIVLDNLETPWERDERGTEDVLARLAHFPRVTLLASIRGGSVPLKPNWAYPHEVRRLESPFDRLLLCAIADKVDRDDPLLPAVLNALDGVPLAIELFAAQAQAANSLRLPWRRWQRERTAMLARGADPHRLSSLDVSLELSLASPRMNDPARRLYAMLGRLPAGLAEDDVDTLMPEDGAIAALSLTQTRVATLENGRLRMLAPVREHAFRRELRPDDRSRLIDYLLMLAAALGPSVLDAAHRAAIFRARYDIDNVEFLVEWASDAGSLERARARDIAVARATAADARVSLGALSLAERGYERALTINRRLLAEDPANERWQRDLSITLNRIGYVRQSQGNLAGALHAYEETRVILERTLAATEQVDADFPNELGITWRSIGDIRMAQGEASGALEAYEYARVIAERLAALDPTRVEWQRNLAASWNRVSDVLVAQGDLAEALRGYENALAIRQRLASSEPWNSECERDVATSWVHVGGVRDAQNDSTRALMAFEEAHAIVARLASAAPHDVRSQRDLSVTWTRIGGVRLAQRDFGGARHAYEQDLAIAQRLAEIDPANAQWQRDLIMSVTNIAELARATGDTVQAVAHFRDALRRTERLRDSGRLAPADEAMLDDLSNRLAALEG